MRSFLVFAVLSLSFAAVQVLDSIYVDDYLYVLVRNTGNVPVYKIVVDYNGNYNGSFNFPEALYLLPGERSSYKAYLPGLGSPSVKAQAVEIPGREIPRPLIITSPVPLYDLQNPEDSFYQGWFEVDYTTINNEKYKIDGSVLYVATIFDATGKFIGSDYTYGALYGISPGEVDKDSFITTLPSNVVPRQNIRVELLPAVDFENGGVEAKVPQELLSEAKPILNLSFGNEWIVPSYPYIDYDRGAVGIESILGVKNLFPPGNYSLKVVMDFGYGTLEDEGNLTVLPGRTNTVELFKGILPWISCRVVEKTTNKQLHDVKVELYKDGKRIDEQLSEKCYFSPLPEGTYTLKASKEGFIDVEKNATAITSLTGAPTTLYIEPRSFTVSGYVLMEGSEKPAPQGMEVVLEYPDGLEYSRTKTDEKGTYIFPRVDMGQYVLSLDLPSDGRFSEGKDAEKRLDLEAPKRFYEENLTVVPTGVDVFIDAKNATSLIGQEANITISYGENGPQKSEQYAEKLSLEVELNSFLPFDANISFPEGCEVERKPTEIFASCLVDPANSTVEGTIYSEIPTNVSLFAKVSFLGNESKVPEWDESNNEVFATIDFLPLVVKGKVLSPVRVDGPTRRIRTLPLQEVALRVDAGNFSFTNVSDENGDYLLVINRSNSSNFAVFAILNYSNKVVVRDSPFNNGVVSLQTRKFSANSTNTVNILFSNASNILSPNMSQAQRNVLRDAGSFYHNIVKAAKFAEQELGLGLNHLLPVDVFRNSNQCNACYTYTTSTIFFRSGASSSILSTDSPDNNEFHEFGHHVYTDAAIDGENNMTPLAAGDRNHGSVANSNSVDSVQEGFAEFFSLMVKGNPRYYWSGTVTNLENNVHWLNRAKKRPDEEFLFASLLWDLADNVQDRGQYNGTANFTDTISLGFRGAWAVLNDPSVNTVRSLYQRLKSLGIGQGDSNNNNVTDLDELFIMHLFFGDVNGNWVWDRNESAGFAGFFTNGNASLATRPEKEPIPGTALALEGLEEGSVVNVSIKMQDGSIFSYVVFPENSSVRIVLPEGAASFSIRGFSPGLSSTEFSMGVEEYWNSVDSAQESGEDVFATAKLDFQPNGIEPPKNFKGDLNGTTALLAWDSALPIILVRSYEGFPKTPFEGDVVAEGMLSEANDSLLGGIDAYYSLFSVRGDEFSIPVHLKLPQDVETQQMQEMDILFIGAGALLLLVLAYLLIWSRRKS